MTLDAGAYTWSDTCLLSSTSSLNLVSFPILSCTQYDPILILPHSSSLSSSVFIMKLPRKKEHADCLNPYLRSALS